MNRIHAHTVGVVVGAIAATGHAVWSLFVWLGIAQPLMDFVLNLHMISAPFVRVQAFDPRLAAELVLLSGIAGYVVGYFIGAALELHELHDALKLRARRHRAIGHA